MTSRSAQRRSESLVRKAQEPSKPRWLVPAVVIGVVAIAAIIAIALAGRGDSGPADTSGLQQIQPVDVSGTAADLRRVEPERPCDRHDHPDRDGKSFDGTPVTIQPTGSPQMLMFVAHWCPHCQQVPLVSDWMKKGGLPAGVQLTTVATGTSSDAPNYPPRRGSRRTTGRARSWPTRRTLMQRARSGSPRTRTSCSSTGRQGRRPHEWRDRHRSARDDPEAAGRPGERIEPSREGAASGRDGSALHRRRARRGCRARVRSCAARLDESRRRSPCRARAEAGLAQVQRGRVAEARWCASAEHRR